MAKPVLGSDNPLTYTEVHALVLGGVVGVLAGYGHVIGRTDLATWLTAAFVAAALGLGVAGRLSKAQATVRREPWYALAALLVGGTAAVALLGGGTAMVA
ncbi:MULTISPECIES: hypothetical protein [Halorussus]|uniref:hypothetical protein n=1 Tax=Halorussus TaxID=1070314 RepID=UPI000E2181C5|nr:MULTISPECIES: hypothetical protein [Halorussus]NHN59912.1 hypothetical protein [Halorussus sp. JP-T4]